MLKRARPSDSLDDCKWERTKVFQASRDLIFISWSHHYRVMNLVGNLRRGVGPLSPSKSATAKQVPPPSPSLAPSPSQQDEDAALLSGLDFSMMTFNAGVDQAPLPLATLAPSPSQPGMRISFDDISLC